jgi:FKBP-type peptidyl-prolyl cis-trans isomerase 2
MQNEKIAAVALVIIIVGALSVYLVATYGEDILKNLFGEEAETAENIEVGDCADVHYTGRFQVNGTVFDTSYEDVAQTWGLYDENRTYGFLKIFVNPNMDLQTPEGYENYTSNMIPGFLNGLVGMKAGDSMTITLSPEDAYGDWNVTLAEEMGFSPYPLDTVFESIIDENISIFSFDFPDANVSVNTTFDYGAIAFEVEGVLNATITNVTETNVTYQLSPENGTQFSFPFFFNANATFIVENNTTFTLHMNFDVGHTFTIYNFYHFKVTDVNDTHATLTVNMGAPDITFVGQTLIFDLEVVEVYKTSQYES